MALKDKTNQQVVDWVNGSSLSTPQKNKIVSTLQEKGFSGSDLLDTRDIDELKDMGFGFAARQLMNLIQGAVTQEGVNEQERIRRAVQEAARRQERAQQAEAQANGGNGNNNGGQNGSFKIRYRYNNRDFITRNQFTMFTHVSQFITILARDEIGIDPEKTQVIYLGHRWSVKEQKTLGDVGFDKNIGFTVSLRVVGGMAALADDEKSQIRERFPDWNYGEFEPTFQKDSLLFDKDNNLRIKMPCGHVFGPQCLYEIINMCAENTSKTGVRCPMPKCGKTEWDFKMLIAAANLNASEISRFSTIFSNRAIKNRADIRQCKSCSNILERPENLLYTRVRCVAKNCTRGEFCWICGEKWQGHGFTVCGNKGCEMERINDVLQKCESKVLTKYYKKPCPVFRACPRCATLIEYDSECKHMKCWGCNKKFCFYCLGLQADNGSWSCQGSSFQCEPAPRQKFK